MKKITMAIVVLALMLTAVAASARSLTLTTQTANVVEEARVLTAELAFDTPSKWASPTGWTTDLIVGYSTNAFADKAETKAAYAGLSFNSPREGNFELSFSPTAVWIDTLDSKYVIGLSVSAQYYLTDRLFTKLQYGGNTTPNSAEWTTGLGFSF